MGKQNTMNKDVHKHKPGRIVMGILSAVLIFVLSIGLVGLIIYKSGEMSLKASAASEGPQAEGITDKSELEKVKSAYKYEDTIPWQDDWVTINDKIYEYNSNTINFLLMGIDHGGELDSETDLSDWNAGQADTIFLLSLNPDTKKISIIGIPRNSMVQVEVYDSDAECIDTIYNQICLQYGYAGGGEMGLAKMKDSVSGLFYELPIHGCCAISFDAVGIITDMLGGIEVTVPDDMTAYHSSYTKGSIQKLTGKNVVPYLRYRDYYALGSPTVRLTRQKEFIKTAAADIMAAIKENPSIVTDIYKNVTPYMNTDITLDEAAYLATKVLDYSIGDDSFYQLTGSDRQVDFKTDSGKDDFYDDYYLDEDSLKQVMIDVFYNEVIVE